MNGLLFRLSDTDTVAEKGKENVRACSRSNLTINYQKPTELTSCCGQKVIDVTGSSRVKNIAYDE